MRYRLAICSNGVPTALTRLRESNPRWTDVFFFEGKYEMGNPSRAGDPARAAAFLTSASEPFPESIAIRLMLASAQETNGDFAAALASVDRVLASKPAHVDAQLGRVRNLSYVGRADEAIAAATRLIDLGAWYVGDAYYWRAWNEYQTRRLDAAWADAQQMMRLLSNTAVYALAGSIAYARRDLETAVRHFDRAFEIDPANCLAVWSAGLVHIDRAAWPSAAETFSTATRCFAAAARTARTELAGLEQSALEPARRASRMSAAQKRVDSAEDLGGQSAFNAAQAFVHTGQKGPALTYIELAESQPALRDKALALRSQIDSMP
jgi:tetratricopeptide (TPR) repeat protein